MIDPEQAQFERLVRQFASESRLLRVWTLQGGLSATMTGLEIEHPDGRRQKLVVRRQQGTDLERIRTTTARVFKLLQVLQLVNVPAPAPVYLEQSGQVLPTPYLVTDYVEGRMEFAPARVGDCVRQLAHHLAQIHSVDGSRADLSFLREQTGPCPELSGAIEPVDPWFAQEQIRDALAAAWPVPQNNRSVLLHGDYWPGNVLWQGDRLATVIDWEDARLGDPLIDLAISRLDIVWIFGIEAMHSFTEHYLARVAIDDAALPYWDLCAALRLMRLTGNHLTEWAAYFHPFGRHDITEQSIKHNCRFFIAQALDRLASQQEKKS